MSEASISHSVDRHWIGTALRLHTQYTPMNTTHFTRDRSMVEPIIWFWALLLNVLRLQHSLLLKLSAGNVSLIHMVSMYIEPYSCCAQSPVSSIFSAVSCCPWRSWRIVLLFRFLSCRCVLRTLPDNRDYSMSWNVIFLNVCSASSYQEDKWYVLVLYSFLIKDQIVMSNKQLLGNPSHYRVLLSKK